MSTQLIASARRTYKYRDGWSHMDEWGKPLKFKILGGRITRLAEQYDEVDTYVFRAIGDKRGDQAEQAQALRDTYSGSGCRHDYDCCGCVTRYATVRRLRPGVFFVRLSGYRNL